MGVAPFVAADAGSWPLALDGGFFAERDGDGDDREAMTPLVWMPGGTGRLAFAGMTGGGTAVTETGAMAARAAGTATCGVVSRGRLRPSGFTERRERRPCQSYVGGRPAGPRESYPSRSLGGGGPEVRSEFGCASDDPHGAANVGEAGRKSCGGVDTIGGRRRCV